MNEIICNSGGALGSDTIWENTAIKYGLKVNAFSYQTASHRGSNKVKILENDFNEGVIQIENANKFLRRRGISKYMNLLARNWAQVKYSREIFAIGHILKPGELSKSGYKCNSKTSVVDGGTGYAVQMGILNTKKVFVFDQEKNSWYKWSYIIEDFVKYENPIITASFAGIGTRKINENGVKAILDIFKSSFKNI